MAVTELENPSTTAVSPWFGGNRMLAKLVGEKLGACPWVGIPFAGGMSEVAHIKARTLQINDKHSHCINLARVMADSILGPKLYRSLRRKVFHPEELAAAQATRKRIELEQSDSDVLFAMNQRFEAIAEDYRLQWAEAYFVAAWMPRHGTSGTDSEFDTGISTRWNATGGDSAVHYWSAVRSLLPWRKILRRGNFTALDGFEFLKMCKDHPKTGIYCDAPWPDAGKAYKHKFVEADQRRLAKVLATYQQATVVVRYGDHPLIREIYPDDLWEWIETGGRTQTNKIAQDVLIV